jgi:phytoene synthase
MSMEVRTWTGTLDAESGSARDRLRRHGKSFYFAGQFLSPAHLNDAASLYAFCRAVDDGVDHAADMPAARLYLDRVARDLDRGQSDDPEVQSFIALAVRKQIDLAVAHQLIAGQRSDLDPVRIPDDAALKQYCYRVAGTVGILMCHVLDVTDRRAHPFAIDLGVAMQLTNIVRDIREDAVAGRIYLPASSIGMRQPEWVLEQLDRGGGGGDVREAARMLLIEADRYYQSGESGLAFLPSRARFAILVAARLYRAIGLRIRARDHVIGAKRTVVPWLGKIRITAAAVRDYYTRNRFHDMPGVHNAGLHQGFAGLPGAEPLGEGAL